METESGVQLTQEEVKLIKSLKRLATKWRNTTNRLWLFSASGTLNVMMYEDSLTNPEAEYTDRGGANPKNLITYIKIPNDGGDW